MSAPWTAADLVARGYGLDGKRVPAAPGPLAGRGGNACPNTQDSENGCAAASVNAGPVSRSGKPAGDAQLSRRSKFGAIRTTAPASWGGERLADSRTGAALARTLDTRKQVGSILDWFEEVSLPVGVDERGKVIRYRPDAMLLLGYVDAPDGGEPAMVVRLLDAKRGTHDTPTSKAKRAALRQRGWNVELWTP